MGEDHKPNSLFSKMSKRRNRYREAQQAVIEIICLLLFFNK